MKKIITFAFTIIFILTYSYSVRAMETKVVGVVEPTLINISAPARVVFSINPNLRVERFKSSDIKIVNNTSSPVIVKLAKKKGNFSVIPESNWKPISTLPSEFNWNKLGTKKSESYIALGFNLDTNWAKIYQTKTFYAAEYKNEEVILGELEGYSISNIKLTSHHGLAFREKKECAYRIIWSFALPE